MKYTRTVLALAAALAAGACGWRRTPVPIVSETVSAALLVGTWSGEYSSRETGRTGSISFELASEKDTAFCDVTMIPKLERIRIVDAQRPETPIIQTPASGIPLKLRFIRLGEGRVSGTLEPYVDPDCGCMVTTTFDGKFTDPDKIEGTYLTQGSNLIRPTSGQWKVTRKAVATR